MTNRGKWETFPCNSFSSVELFSQPGLYLAFCNWTVCVLVLFLCLFFFLTSEMKHSWIFFFSWGSSIQVWVWILISLMMSFHIHFISSEMFGVGSQYKNPFQLFWEMCIFVNCIACVNLLLNVYVFILKSFECLFEWTVWMSSLFEDLFELTGQEIPAGCSHKLLSACHVFLSSRNWTH